MHKVVAICQGKSSRRGTTGFTLVEMLAVIFIIAILVSTLAVGVSKMKSLARQADCKSSMRQLGAAVLIYRSDNGGSNPAWLSCLYPNYVDDLHLFVCRSDKSIPRGTGTSRPPPVPKLTDSYDATQVDDNRNNHGATNRNPAVAACSYFYEFSEAPSPWKTLSYSKTPKPPGLSALEPFKLYCDFKNAQLLYGDDANECVSYSTSRIPIIRCYHHANEGYIRGFANQDALTTRPNASPQITNERITINVAHAGNVYVGPLWWEGALLPGEQ
ncbi:MAG: type II secretion system protein [Kiritimatiellia bacterium]